ncbi:FAD-binding oxidoreductase [Synechococcus sp. CS-205]|uniref:NAD(P)/FAD-dependent oxidoreductase n=1 Tax=Synechococcus sp. CS-205 TaxID=2847984 RepID=UPI00223A89BD|nr:FAD-dependent oxidoreductase [Synechococcus sp. CS-205]MCT0248977.1 FAD-binding oxidoreductase [Synechococcus sp. CS-205]
MIGGGIVALATAWLLQRHGHRVQLIAPDALGTTPQESRSGSAAALGVLMAHVFHRSKGRAWRLRQTSLGLWRRWRQELSERGCPIPFQAGLLLLARDPDDQKRLRQLQEQRQAMGFPLSWWEPSQLRELELGDQPEGMGGLHSAQDGQLDPLAAMAAFRRDGLRCGLQLSGERVVALERRPAGWRIHRRSAITPVEVDWLVVAAGLASEALLRPLGHQLPLQPVLGQCLELAPAAPIRWPCPVVWQGLNLVPRPGGGLWLGATLEPGEQADPSLLEPMRQLGGAAPSWLREATVIRRWQGLRARPQGQPAPLLEKLEPGLLLLSGHYRNGVLLAPGSAQWALEQIEGFLTCR